MHATFWGAPAPGDAGAVARAWGAGSQPLSLQDLLNLAADLNVDVSSEALSASRSLARLTPRIDGGWTAWVGDAATPFEGVTGTSRANRLLARLAHELAHTCFYDKRTAPHRRINGEWGRVGRQDAEEDACDAIAAALVAPPSCNDARDAADAVRKARQAQVPLAMVVQAARIRGRDAAGMLRVDGSCEVTGQPDLFVRAELYAAASQGGDDVFAFALDGVVTAATLSQEARRSADGTPARTRPLAAA